MEFKIIHFKRIGMLKLGLTPEVGKKILRFYV